MKIVKVRMNNRRKAFELRMASRNLVFPYSQAMPAPSAADPVIEAAVDDELGREAFTYTLKSGREGSVHVEQVLDYNDDPAYLRNMMVYKLTIEAQKRVKSSDLSRREIIRRLGTSAAQFYRLLDQTNYSKSIDQLLSLLHVLHCSVDLKVRPRRSGRQAA